MSKKILRIGAAIAAIAVNFIPIPGVGQALSIAIKAALSASIALASGILLKPKSPKVSPNATDRLHASMRPDEPRKLALGYTALATDVRYQSFTGDDQEYYHQILCVASHQVQSIEEVWFDSEMAWSASGGVAGKSVGYLEATVRNPGTSGNGIAVDSVWTADCTLTGCAYLYLRFKLTGNDKKAESPFASAIPSRVTVRGRGAFVPDLREGGVDASDQATWAWFSDDAGRNPANQLLLYLLGWRINGKLAVGRGIPPARIDLDSFITAANMCDEPVALAAGGTEPRYCSDGLFSEGDDPATVIGNLTTSMNAVLRDTGGRIGVYVLHDDLDTPVAAFTETDILGGDDWEQTPPIDEMFNVVRGRHPDASNEALYQLVEYPEVAIDSVDDIERIDVLELAMVHSAPQAQRLAKQRLQRSLYRGVFSAEFGHRAWQVNLGDPVTLSHGALGWANKKFRVAGHGIGIDGVVRMVLQEEHPDIYQWDAEESPAVVAAEPTGYDPLLSPFIQALREATASSLVAFLTNENHTLPAAADGTVETYDGATGTFRIFSGTEEVGASFTLTTAENDQGLDVDYVDQTYTVTGGLDPGEANATLTILATGEEDTEFEGIELEKTFSLGKSKAGGDGSPAKLLRLIHDRQTIYYDSAGSPTPATQTNTFTAAKQNTIATVSWSLTDFAGNPRAPVTDFLSAATGDQVTMTEAQFAAARDGTQGVIVTASLTDGATLTDKVSVVRVQQGAGGTNAKTVTVETDRGAFTFDGGGNLSPTPQSAIVTANPQNFVGGNVVWSYTDNLGTASATLAALVTATSTNVRTVPSTVFTGTPTRTWIKVTATGQGAESGLSDSVTLLRLQDGSNVLAIQLSNEAHTVPTDSAGSNGDFSAAMGQMKVWWGATDVTATATLSEVSETGCTGTINTAANNPVSGQAKGHYRVTAMSADTATYKMRAVHNPGSGNITQDHDFTLAKSKTGAAGLHNAQARIYRRAPAGSPPTLPSVTTTYTFATGVLTGLNNSWTTVPQAGTDPQWVSVATATGTGATDTIGSGEWPTPVIETENGINAATVFVYQRNSSGAVPSVPASTLTYTFATGVLSGTLGSWTQSIPAEANGKYLFVTTATALGTGTTDTIATGEWATPRLMGQEGPVGGVKMVSTDQSVLVVNGNEISTGVGAWSHVATSLESKVGGAAFGFRADTTGLYVAGITLDALVTGNFTAGSVPDYGWYCQTFGAAWAFVDNNSVVGSGGDLTGTHPTGTAGDYAQVVYVDGQVRWYMNGALRRVKNIGTGWKFFAGVQMHSGKITDIGFDAPSAVESFGDRGGSALYDDFTYQAAAMFGERWARWTTVGGSGEFSSITDADTPGGRATRIGNNAGNDMGWFYWLGNPIPFDPDKLYEMQLIAKRPAGTGVLYAGFEGLTADMTTMVNASGSGTHSSQHFFVAAGAAPGTSWTAYTGYVQGRHSTGTSTAAPDPTAPGKMHTDTVYVRPVIVANYSGATGQMDLGEVEVNVIDGLYEINADVTKEIVGPTLVEVPAKHDGTFEDGILPKNVPFSLVTSRGSDITDDATWTATLKSGTAGFDSPLTVTSGKAILSIDTLATTAEIELAATVGGLVVDRHTVRIVKQQGDPPVTGGGGGGSGSGGATNPITGWSNSTGYVSPCVAPMTLAAGAGGEIACSAAIGFYVNFDGITDFEVPARAKWQWRTVGGSWADIATEIESSPHASIVDEGTGLSSGTHGFIQCNMTKTGLTPGIDYEVQCLGRNVDTSRSISFYGASGPASAVAS